MSPSIYSASEVITHDKWSDLKPEGRIGFSSWIKDAFHSSKNDSPDEIHQKLQLVLSTTPIWDRYYNLFLECYICMVKTIVFEQVGS